MYSHSLNINLLNQHFCSSSDESGCGEGRGHDYLYYINKKNDQDGVVTIIAYTAVLAAIIIPNVNQIE